MLPALYACPLPACMPAFVNVRGLAAGNIGKAPHIHERACQTWDSSGLHRRRLQMWYLLGAPGPDAPRPPLEYNFVHLSEPYKAQHMIAAGQWRI